MALEVLLSLLTQYPRTSAGTTTYAQGLLSGLCQQSLNDDRLAVLVNREGDGVYRRLASPRIEVLRSPAYDRRERLFGRVPALASSFALASLRRTESSPSSKVVHYLQSVPVPYVQGKTVVALHDVQHHDYPEYFSSAALLWRRLSYDAAARRADRVITISDDARDRICERLGIAPERVSVIHHGIDQTHFVPDAAPSDEAVEHQLGLPERFVLYPAVMLPHKNHRRLLSAMREVDDLTLVLTGQDYGRKSELLEQAAREGIRGRVRHLGRVPGAWLPVLYRRATALIFPSLYEGFGSPPLEAMASGLPVACSDRGPLPEITGDAALRFDPEDIASIAGAIVRICGDDGLRSGLRARGFRQVRPFTWAKSAAEHLKVYRQASVG